MAVPAAGMAKELREMLDELTTSQAETQEFVAGLTHSVKTESPADAGVLQGLPAVNPPSSHGLR